MPRVTTIPATKNKFTPDGVTKEKMFDLDLYCYRIDEEKRGQYLMAGS